MYLNSHKVILIILLVMIVIYAVNKIAINIKMVLIDTITALDIQLKMFGLVVDNAIL